MRTSLAPGNFFKAARTSATTGAHALAAAVRSLPWCVRNSISASNSRGTSASSPSSCPPVNLANTSRVANATPGLTSTAGSSGNSRGGDNNSPTPRMMRGRGSRHTGTSAPTERAASSRRGSSKVMPLARARSRTAAAASAEPPPRPAATGTFFSSRNWPPFSPVIRCRKAPSALSTRLSATAPLLPAKGPLTSSLSSAPGRNVSTSATSAKATRLSRS